MSVLITTPQLKRKVEMKKAISVILAAAISISILAGCSQPAPEASPSAAPSPSPVEAKTSINGFNSDLYKPDTLMMKVDGSPVYWTEFLYWVASDIFYIYQSTGSYPTNWDEKIGEDKTLKSYVVDSAKNAISMYRAVEKKAADLGIKLSEEDEAEINSEIQAGIAAYETEDAFNEYLRSSYLDQNLYRYMLKVSILYKRIFEKSYGEKAEKFSDADTLSYAEKEGYIKAKHIYMPSSTEEDKDKEVKDKMQSLLESLKAAGSDKERAELFDKLMKENSQDGGLAVYPDGYLFKDGDMDPQFQSAAEAIAVGSISDIVKSSYGYHIILRLPVGADDRVFTSEGSSEGGTDTLRYYAAYDTFRRTVDGWVKDAKTETTEALNNLDFGKIYK